MRIRTVIADDEPLARERMKRLASQDPDLHVVKECRNGKEVLESLQSDEIDLLLLDIQMPGMNAFEALAEMKLQRPPTIIFVTAHDRYAIKAFDFHAADYLLKPVEPTRFREAIKRVRAQAEIEAALLTQERFSSALSTLESLASAEPAQPTRFMVRSGSKELLVNVGEIAWIEAADYYVCLHVAEKKHMLRESIKNLEAQLDPKKFIRIHRSAIVNIDHVREIHREGRSEGWTLLANGDRVRMSTAGWQKLLSASSGTRRKTEVPG
jgi:two-component system LytT family response regulator